MKMVLALMLAVAAFGQSGVVKLEAPDATEARERAERARERAERAREMAERARERAKVRRTVRF